MHDPCPPARYRFGNSSKNLDVGRQASSIPLPPFDHGTNNQHTALSCLDISNMLDKVYYSVPWPSGTCSGDGNAAANMPKIKHNSTTKYLASSLGCNPSHQDLGCILRCTCTNGGVMEGVMCANRPLVNTISGSCTNGVARQWSSVLRPCFFIFSRSSACIVQGGLSSSPIIHVVPAGSVAPRSAGLVRNRNPWRHSN
jgi:hypothetical protein